MNMVPSRHETSRESYLQEEPKQVNFLFCLINALHIFKTQQKTPINSETNLLMKLSSYINRETFVNYVSIIEY